MPDPCPQCGDAVVQTGRGRPRTYCTDRCRRRSQVEDQKVRQEAASLHRALTRLRTGAVTFAGGADDGE